MVQAMPVTVSDVDTQPPPMVVVQQPPQPVLDVPQDAGAVVENAAEENDPPTYARHVTSR